MNGGKGGAPSSYIHQCVYKFAPKDADLVLVEFALNDKQPDCGVNTPVRCRQPLISVSDIALVISSVGPQHDERMVARHQMNVRRVAFPSCVPSILLPKHPKTALHHVASCTT